MPATTIEQFAERFRADAAATPAGERPGERRIATILRQLGWESASEEPAERVAPTLAMMFDGCARGHRDLRRLHREMAAHLRANAHALDGGGAAASAWEPLAISLVERYTASAPARANG